MRRDLKIGMLIGVGVVICATVALSLWPGASVEERVRQTMLQAAGSETPTPPTSKPGTLVIPEHKVTATNESFIRPFAGEVRPKPDPGTAVQTGPGPAAEPAKAKPAETIHIVGQGETLSKIAQHYYGSSAQWQKILQANSAVLKAPEKIKPGMRLVIPDAKAGPAETNKAKPAGHV
jgi:nucleoid-associated protein YgaU